MEKSNISLLVLNAIKDTRTIIDNYDFFSETDPDGLYSDFLRAGSYIASLHDYYKRNTDIEDALFYLHSYYEPYLMEFENPETPDMKQAKKLVDIFFPGTAISTLVSAFVYDFFPVALTMGTLSLVSYLYVKTREMQRAGTLRHLKINDTEAKSITRQELSDVLGSDKETVLEALAKDYTFKAED